jgi:hypothetical protein
MAKYSRFDPRNKKNGRNKFRALTKDMKIRDAEYTKNEKYKVNQSMVFDEEDEESISPVS